MLRELARLSGGMLFLGGHIGDPATLRTLARDEPPVVAGTPRRRPRAGAAAGAPRDWRTPLELLLLAAIWGGSFLFLRIAAPEFGPTALVDVRLALGALVLSPFLWQARRQLAAAGWLKIAAIGLVNTLLPFLLFAWSAERAPAGVSAIVNSMAVPFAALAAFALFGERIGGLRLAGLAIGLVGVVVLAGGHVDGIGFGPAVAAGTAAAFLYGVSANLVKRHFAGLPPAAVAAATVGRAVAGAVRGMAVALHAGDRPGVVQSPRVGRGLHRRRLWLLLPPDPADRRTACDHGDLPGSGLRRCLGVAGAG